MKRNRVISYVIGFFILFSSWFFEGCITGNEKEYETWSHYLGDKSVSHYSSLNEIDTNNVQQLKIAWEFHSGDADTQTHSRIECNPIIVNGILYGVSPQLKLFALDAADGRAKWVFDPFLGNVKKEISLSRGVTYWSDGNEGRILYTVGSFLYAIDASTGKKILSFGEDGRVDLHDGLDRDVKKLWIEASSPGIIYKDVIIIGSRVGERDEAAPGHIRAFDVRTGKRRWIFHTIPQPGELGYDTWENKDAWKYVGGANSWAGMSLDEKRGVVYVSTGSATHDFYGGFRVGQNLFADCVIALEAATGKYVWHFQTVHHNLWDMDNSAPPNLVTIERDGKKIDAVVQITKAGYAFVLDRDSGKPLFPVDEIAVNDISTLPGEKPWPTQPVPQLPKPFGLSVFTEADINPYVSEASKEMVRKRLLQLENGNDTKVGNRFLPPSEKGTLVFPGFGGGGEWGGAAYDPTTGLIYINANQIPCELTIVKKSETQDSKVTTVFDRGRIVYFNNCMACHGKNREGTENYPSLKNMEVKYSSSTMMELINNGRRMMPAFSQINEDDKKALITFLLDKKTEGALAFKNSETEDQDGAVEKSPFIPYTMTGYIRMNTPEGYPAIKPPWGTLTAININTGENVWEIPLGEYKELTKRGIPITGTSNYGGAVVTSGGLLFIAATLDNKFRAYNKRTGQLLWETDLPASGFATPSTYRVNGKQYIVIACGGGMLGTPSGDSYVAFALP